MSSIMKLLRRIGGAKAVPTSGDAGQLAVWKAGTAATDAVSLYFHDGTQWVEILDTAIKAVAVSEKAPATPSVGALWFKASTKEFSAWDGAQWSHVAFRNTQNTFTKPQNIDVNDASPALHIRQLGTGNALFIKDEANPAATPFVVDKGSKVGIGISTPVSPLDVLVAPNARILFGTNGSDVMVNAVNAGNTDLTNFKLNGTRLDLQTQHTDRLSVGTSGQIGINVAENPQMQIRLRGSSAAVGEYALWVENKTPAVLFSVENHGKIVTGNLPASPYNLTTATPANLNVGSDGSLFRSTSSIKYKKDVEALDPVLTERAVAGLRPVWYRSKAPNGDDKAEWSHIGLIAEEVAKVEPRLVTYKTKEVSQDDDGNIVETVLETPEPEGVDYARLSVLLLDYVQRLEKRVAALEARK